MVVPRFIQSALKNEDIIIYDDGSQSRVFCHVEDVIKAVLLVIADDSTIGEVFNVGSGINHSVNEVAAMISENTVNIPPRIGESRVTLANTDRMYGVFSWQPKVKLEDWIAKQL